MARYLVIYYYLHYQCFLPYRPILFIFDYYSSGGQTGADGCDSSRSSTTVGTIIKNANSTLSTRMNTFWPSNTGDNNK